MFGFSKKKQIPQEPPIPKEEVEGVDFIKFYSTDTNRQRAEKIVWVMNLRGSVGDYILAVLDALEAYDLEDAKQATVIDKTT